MAARLSAIVDGKVAAGEYLQKDLNYLSNLKRPVLDGVLAVSDERLEKLRRLCQLWAVDLTPAKISSHRKFIGAIIVAAKRAIYPFLKVLLKDSFAQQRDFNAAAIALLTDLASSVPEKPVHTAATAQPKAERRGAE